MKSHSLGLFAVEKHEVRKSWEKRRRKRAKECQFKRGQEKIVYPRNRFRTRHGQQDMTAKNGHEGRDYSIILNLNGWYRGTEHNSTGEPHRTTVKGGKAQKKQRKKSKKRSQLFTVFWGTRERRTAD